MAKVPSLPEVAAELVTAEQLPPGNPNRAQSWLWASATEANLDFTIKRATDLGVEIIFLMDFFPNYGDYRYCESVHQAPPAWMRARRCR